MGAEVNQTAVNQDILSERLIGLLGEVRGNTALEGLLVVKEDEWLAALMGSASINEKIRISNEGYASQCGILIDYLASKGIESKRVGNCHWFVSASLTPQQIYELAAEQDTPIKKIVPGSGLVKFEYGFGN